MDKAMEAAYTVAGDLFGPGSVVPWWAWVATLLMIFGGFFIPTGTEKPEDLDRLGPLVSPYGRLER